MYPCLIFLLFLTPLLEIDPTTTTAWTYELELFKTIFPLRDILSIPKLTVIIGCPEEKETPFATTQTFNAQTTKISLIEKKIANK